MRVLIVAAILKLANNVWWCRMPKLKQNKNGVELSPVDVEKQTLKLGGANKNPVKGVYKVQGESNQKPSPPLMIKAETRNAGKEFSELLAGAFIGKVVQQKQFPYAENFVLTHPGVISYPESPDKPEQRVMVQPFNKGAEKLLEKRRGIEELRPDLAHMKTGAEKSRQLADNLDKQAFAATIVMSVLIADYSVHLDNFMKVDGNKPLRVDFGSSCKNILRPQNNKNVYASPPDTKIYKKYMEIWTDDPETKSSITEFMWKNKDYFSPEEMGKMMGAACEEVLKAAYKDAPLEDLLKIYKHLHGENHPELRGQIKKDYQEIKALRKQINELLEKQEKASGSEQVAMYSKIKALEDQLALKSVALNNRDGADNLKQDIKVGIVKEMKEVMVQRAKAVIQEGIKQGHDERLAQIKKDSPIVAQEIKETEAQIKKEKSLIEDCKLYGKPIQDAFSAIVNESDIRSAQLQNGDKYPKEAYVEVKQPNGKPSKFYTMKSIQQTPPPADPLQKMVHHERINKLVANFNFLANTQQNFREATQNLNNLEAKVELLYTGQVARPAVAEKQDLPLPVPHEQALGRSPNVVNPPAPATASVPSTPDVKPQSDQKPGNK